MSSQTRIDQFFKSTSGNKSTLSSVKNQHVNALNRSKTGDKLKTKRVRLTQTFGNSSFTTQARDKKSRQPSNSSSEISSENVIFVGSIRSQNNDSLGKSAESRLPSEKSFSSDDSISGVNSKTPLKKTIKAFAKACNSPSPNRTPGKISLKRQNGGSTGISTPPRKSPAYCENVDHSKTYSPKMTNFPKLPESQKSSLPCEILEPEIIELSGENSSKSLAGRTNIEPKERSFDKKIKIDDNSSKTRENEQSIGREMAVNDNQSNSNQIGTKVTPKKRKMRDSSSSRNSPSTSGWKVRCFIETPERSMTALSSNWQKTLESSQELALLNSAQVASKDNVQTLSDNEGNDENLSVTSPRGNSFSVNKSSPRRALFSPQNSSQKVNFEDNGYDTSPPTNSVENTAASLRDGTKTSPQGILRSTNLRINGNSNSNERINEVSNLPKKIVGISKISSEDYVSFNLSAEVGESVNLPTKTIGTSNSPTKTIGTSNSPTKTIGTSNLPTKFNGTSNSLIKSIGTSNSPTKTIGTSNSPTKTIGTSNSPTKTTGTSNSPTKTIGTSNLPTKNIGTSNSSTKNLNPPKTPTKFNETSNSSTKMMNPPKTPTKFHETSNSSTKMTSPPKTPTKLDALLATPTKAPFRSSKSTFSPRVKYSPQKAKSPQKAHKERVDTHLATRAVDNLNQAKQGIIPMNDFDLELIYTKKSFEFEYGSLNADTAIKYEAADVKVPEEKHADHFFMVLVNVFSEPINCGYFNEQELDTVFSILTLSPEAQSLLARMLKRKRGWHRVDNESYPEIANDLRPVFRELVDHGFLDDDIANEDISKSLSLLQVYEMRALCQSMKVKHNVTKPMMIKDLVKLANQKKVMFVGMKSPSTVVIEKVNAALGFCIRLPDRIENLLNRIIILLIPTQDPKENMAEAFRMLIQVHFGDIRFPETPKERFPLFRNRLHLIRYAEARSALTQILNASEAKDWDTVRTLGQLAYDHLEPYFERDDSCDETETSLLPTHVKRFDPNYAWVKVMSKSVEGFKKTNATMEKAAKFLHTLVSSSNKIPGNRTRWYSELALIESFHRKNYEISAEITIAALMQDRLSEVDAAEMIERARKLTKKKSVSPDTKERIKVAVRRREEMFISISEPTIKEIEATKVAGNTTGSKSTWSMNIGGADTGYLKVEDVALRHYLGEGFRSGVHCEGALPVTIFATLLWDEIYTVSVPGAFVSSYQNAPLDLYTSHFLESRRERVEEKLKLIRRLDLDYLSTIMHEDYVKYRDYQSLMHGNLFQDADDFKDFIECLGIDAVVGICERLAGNYNQWKSGFPDLAVWNPVTKKCKIVEVKGPGDSLSTKQKLWIQFLECLGVEVEVCIVKGTTKRFAT